MQTCFLQFNKGDAAFRLVKGRELQDTAFVKGRGLQNAAFMRGRGLQDAAFVKGRGLRDAAFEASHVIHLEDLVGSFNAKSTFDGWGRASLGFLRAKIHVSHPD